MLDNTPMLQPPKNEVVLLAIAKTDTTPRRFIEYSRTPWLIPYKIPNLRAVFETVLRRSLFMTMQTFSKLFFMRRVYGRPKCFKTVKKKKKPHPNMQAEKSTQSTVFCPWHFHRKLFLESHALVKHFFCPV
jgi:hypothetical protein